MTSEWAYSEETNTADLGGLLIWARGMNARQWNVPGSGSVWWNGAARKKSVLAKYGYLRGGLDDLTHVTAFWCDFDAQKRGYTLQQGMDILLSMAMQPTFIIFSGGGLQAVHVLRRAWSVGNAAAAQEYQDYSLALYRTVFAQASLELDTSVHEAARQMRLPGFINRKPERAGVQARIVYQNLTSVYDPETIRERITLPPPKPRLLLSAALLPPSPDGTYRVSQEFVHHLLDDPLTPPVERHPTLLALALTAARAGLPQDKFLALVRPVAARWFAGELHRADRELDSLTTWAYQRTIEDAAQGIDLLGINWLVKLDELTGQLSLASDDQQESANNPVMPMDEQETGIMLAEQQATERMSLSELRHEQEKLIRDYLAARPKRGLGTYLLVATPPGAGKSHAAFQIAQSAALEAQSRGEEHGNVALLTLFKSDEQGWESQVEQFGVDSNNVFYLVARNADPHSAGYCGLNTQAQGVAKKGWNVVQTLCARCPYHMQCKDNWYLSQFERSKRSPILLARHQHGLMDEIMQHRKVVVFDESPLDVVGQPSVLGLDDLVFNPPVYMLDQYPTEMQTLANWINALRGIVASNERPGLDREGRLQFATEQHVKLGGRGLFALWESTAGRELLMRVVALPEGLIKKAANPALSDLSPEAVQLMPLNFVYELWRLFRFELDTYYLADKQAWNSRIVVYGDKLWLFGMEPFSYTQNTKIIITDATGQPQFYPIAFSDQQGRPRGGIIFDHQLEHRCHITQFTNPRNTRAAFRSKRAAKQKIVPFNPDAALFEQNDTLPPDSPSQQEYIDNTAFERSKALITHLVQKHDSSLLVVTYKAVAAKLGQWARVEGVIPETQIQWYGNLRGRNAYKDLQAVLLIGTPRIQPMHLLAMAQAWYWRDELPVSAEQMIRWRQYPGYVDPSDKKGRKAWYLGYKDERVNRLYVELVEAEMRQCYERIRPNASDGDRFVYLATDFCAADQVDELMPLGSWHIDESCRALVQELLDEGQEVWESQLVKALQEAQNISINTAREAARRVLPSMNVELGARSKLRPAQRVEAWLKEDSTRLNLTNFQIAMQCKVSIDTVKRVRKKFIRI